MTKGGTSLVKIVKPKGIKIRQRLKVAAYARVSMLTDNLQHSLANQVSYYTKLINSRADWKFAGVYADAGISGTRMTKRKEFQRLIADCEKGLIDMVLVKSISRFSRDTVDFLNVVRNLKDLNIAIYFEREGINSLSSDGELCLTLLASFAQEESRSISENVKWFIRKNFQQGLSNGHKNAFGYRWDGYMYRVVPEEGEIVKEIFARYLSGESAYSIAKDMAGRGIKGLSGSLMEQTTVKDIISNISYTGTQLLQKTYIDERHMCRKNNGEYPKYLVEDVFEALVSDEDFSKAQDIRKKRAAQMPEKEMTKFSGKMKCGFCGCGISRRNNGALGTKRWVCNTRERKGRCECNLLPLNELDLEKAVEGVSTFREIRVYNDRLDIFLDKKNVKSVPRVFNGKRGRNAYTNKIWCVCGAKRRRSNFKKFKAWICLQSCGAKRLREDELFRASKELLGTDYQGRVAADIDKIVVSDECMEFVYYEGKVVLWQGK